MKPGQLEDLLKKSESKKHDFKRELRLNSAEDRKEFAKDISSFANRLGGVLIIGKEDPDQGGQLVGVVLGDFNPERMEQIATTRCDPPVDITSELVPFDGKQLIFITIPNSEKKPHKIVGTTEVWIRRGKTKSLATPEEIIQMRQETERKLETRELQKSEFDPIASFKERADFSAFISLSVMSYLSVRLWTFWALGKGLDLSNWITAEALLSPLVPILLLAVLKFLSGNSILTKLINVIRNISFPYIMSLGFFVVITTILNISIQFYPNSVSVYFKTVWFEFLVVSIISFIIALILITASLFPIMQYHTRLDDPSYQPDALRELKEMAIEYKQKMKYVRRKSIAFLIFGLLSLTLIIGPLDIAIGIFVPTYHVKDEVYCHSYFDTSDRIYLFIYCERVTSTELNIDCRFYRLVQREYTILPAKFPSLSLIRINNPTNITLGTRNDPAISASSFQISEKNVGSVSVNTSKNIDFKFLPDLNNFSYIEYSFPEIGGYFVANLTYWKFLDNVDISVTLNEPIYHNLGNSNYLEVYTFLIENNDEIQLETTALEFNRFWNLAVNASTTKVYIQGGERPTDLMHSNRRLGLWSRISPGYTLNLTISFQSSDIG